MRRRGAVALGDVAARETRAWREKRAATMAIEIASGAGIATEIGTGTGIGIGIVTRAGGTRGEERMTTVCMTARRNSKWRPMRGGEARQGEVVAAHQSELEALPMEAVRAEVRRARVRRARVRMAKERRMSWLTSDSECNASLDPFTPDQHARDVRLVVCHAGQLLLRS